jgi:hypothetical protein
VGFARRGAAGPRGHEQRLAAAMIKVIEVHAWLPGSKRERNWSLSRTGLQ